MAKKSGGKSLSKNYGTMPKGQPLKSGPQKAKSGGSIGSSPYHNGNKGKK